MPRLVEPVIEDPRLCLAPASVEALVHFLDEAATEWSIPTGPLALAFVDEATCRTLHESFFRDPSLTDVMTFPGDPSDGHAGDLAICPASAATAATEYGQTFAAELTLYLIHGWLHLAGLDDRTIATAAAMRVAERTLMERVEAAGLVLAARWAP